MKARPLGRRGVVVGDRVRVEGDVSGDEGSLARIVEVNERLTTLRRTAEDDDPVERVIVANADQLVVVTALADPEPQPRLIDRALVAAYDAGLAPLLCLTKADLADPETLLATYRSLGVPWVVTQRGGDLGRAARAAGRPGQRAARLQRRRASRRWSTPWCPDAMREVGIVNAVTGRGRHTSTSAYLLPLPGRRRLDHRHARDPVVRARARAARGPDRGVPRPRRDDRGLPARLHPRRPTSPSAGSTRRSPPGGPTPTGWRRSGGCWPRGSEPAY